LHEAPFQNVDFTTTQTVTRLPAYTQLCLAYSKSITAFMWF